MDFERDVDGCEGLWWLVSDPTRQIHGRLNCSVSPWQLELSGSLLPTRDPWSESVETHEPVIHGTVEGTRKVSLVHVDWFATRPDALPIETWSVQWYMTGKHLSSDTVTVSTIEVEFDNLIDWALPAGVTSGEPADAGPTFVLPRAALASGDVRIGSVSLVSGFRTRSNRRSLSADQSVRFVVSPHDPLELVDVRHQVVDPLREFISFCTLQHTPMKPIGLTLIEDPLSPTFMHVPYLAPPKPEPRPYFDVLVPFRRLGDRLPSVLDAWLGLRGTHRAAIVPLLTPLDAPFLYANVHMLLAALAAEGYHQASLPQKVSDAEHEVRLRTIEADIQDPELRRWAVGALEQRTSKGAQRQFSEVLDRAGATGHRIRLEVPNFERRAAKARHRVAHPSRYDDEDGTEMLFLSIALQWAVRHCLLLELGFAEDEANTIVANSHPFQRDMRNVEHFLDATAAD